MSQKSSHGSPIKNSAHPWRRTIFKKDLNSAAIVWLHQRDFLFGIVHKTGAIFIYVMLCIFLVNDKRDSIIILSLVKFLLNCWVQKSLRSYLRGKIEVIYDSSEDKIQKKKKENQIKETDLTKSVKSWPYFIPTVKFRVLKIYRRLLLTSAKRASVLTVLLQLTICLWNSRDPDPYLKARFTSQ